MLRPILGSFLVGALTWTGAALFSQGASFVEPEREKAELAIQIVTKTFLGTLRRCHGEGDPEELLGFIDPVLLDDLERAGRKVEIETFPMLRMPNIQVAADLETVAAKVGLDDGSEEVVVLRVVRRSSGYFFAPVGQPDPETGRLTPWILRLPL